MVDTRVVVSVSGGNVNGIFSNDPNVEVFLVDYDNLQADSSGDCDQRLPVGTIAQFRSLARGEIHYFPAFAKLLTRIST